MLSFRISCRTIQYNDHKFSEYVSNKTIAIVLCLLLWQGGSLAFIKAQTSYHVT